MENFELPKTQAHNIERTDMTWLLFSRVSTSTQPKIVEEIKKMAKELKFDVEENIGYFFPYTNKNEPGITGYLFIGLSKDINQQELFKESVFLRRLRTQEISYSSMKTYYDALVGAKKKSANMNFVVGETVTIDGKEVLGLGNSNSRLKATIESISHEKGTAAVNINVFSSSIKMTVPIANMKKLME